jgi:hypothetical protein
MAELQILNGGIFTFLKGFLCDCFKWTVEGILNGGYTSMGQVDGPKRWIFT